MGYALDLLGHARRLLASVGCNPSQADLRRSVSACYYAVFHLLVASASELVGQSASSAVRLRMMRAFAHREMREVCKHFDKITATTVPGQLDGLVSAPIHPDLAFVPAAFGELQQARHLADYDFELPVTDVYAFKIVGDAERCLKVWPTIQALPETRTFLTALLLADRWTRRG